MKIKIGIYLLMIGSIVLSACGGAAAPVMGEVPASHTPGPAASPTLPPTLTPLPSPTGTPDSTQTLQALRQQELHTLLVEPLEAAIAASGGDWFILLQEMDGEVLYEREADTPVWVDHIIHLPVSMLFLRAIEDTGVTEMKVFLTVNRDYETSLRQTLFEMQVYGNESAAASILGRIPKYGLNINQTLQSWNMADTSLPNKMASTQNLVSLLEGLASRSLLSEESSVLIEAMLDQGDKASNPLYQHAPAAVTIHDQGVAVSTREAMLGELAVVKAGDSTYLLAIFGFNSQRSPATYAALAQAYAEMVWAFWRYVEVR